MSWDKLPDHLAHRARSSRSEPGKGVGAPTAPAQKTLASSVGGNKGKQSKSQATGDLIAELHLLGLPTPTVEHRFHPVRKWRFDLAYIPQMIAVEVDGGVYTQGRHTRGKGYENDIEKITEAMLLGWTVYRFTTGQVKSGYASASIQRALEGI